MCDPISNIMKMIWRFKKKYKTHSSNYRISRIYISISGHTKVFHYVMNYTEKLFAVCFNYILKYFKYNKNDML